ncbi:MAG: hypothetical protein J5449_07220 [Oscillospiraceae bacterium]|nr:hypothetical protein [Oscillospiraceae bacterium]
MTTMIIIAILLTVASVLMAEASSVIAIMQSLVMLDEVVMPGAEEPF